MDDQRELAMRFDRQRGRLRSVAYRITGSLGDADDAVQEAWLRLQRARAEEIENFEGWLTTVVARICLNVLRDRQAHAHQSLDRLVPEPIISTNTGDDPEHQALLADAVGIALQVVLEALNPAERLAFVLHDLFAVPFDDIAVLIERSPEATRQLASRARRRIRGAAPPPEPDPARQRAVVDAYFAAARGGDLDALVALLDPEVVARSHRRTGVFELRGAHKVAQAAMAARQFAPFVRPALINGTAGAVAFDGDTPFAILAFTIIADRAVTIDIFNDEDRASVAARMGANERNAMPCSCLPAGAAMESTLLASLQPLLSGRTASSHPSPNAGTLSHEQRPLSRRRTCGRSACCFEHRLTGSLRCSGRVLRGRWDDGFTGPIRRRSRRPMRVRRPPARSVRRQVGSLSWASARGTAGRPLEEAQPPHL
jgi:RNA polymerase sigma factor (sigma-70 family)